MSKGGALILVIAVIGTFGLFIFAGVNSGYINNLVVLRDGTNPLTDNWDAGSYNITVDGNLNITGTVDGKDVGGTHIEKYTVSADSFGRPNTNPPAIIEQDNIILYSFTLDTDKAFYKFPTPLHYSTGDLNISVYWTNDGGIDDNASDVEWQMDYQVTAEGEALSGSHASSPDTIVDTYSSESGWIEHHSGVMSIADADFEIGDCLFLKLMAITPAGDPLTCDPHLIGICIEYFAENLYDGE